MIIATVVEKQNYFYAEQSKRGTGGRTMTCKDCAKFTECESLATHDLDHSHRMWLIEFWGNAEERCREFEKKEEVQ